MKSPQTKDSLANHKTLLIAATIIVLFMGYAGYKAVKLGIAPQEKATDSTQTIAGDGSLPASSAFKIGEPAQDETLEFRISSIKCGLSSVTDSSGKLTKYAQGSYCMLRLSVKNNGDTAQSFNSPNQYIYNGEGQRYTSNYGLAYYANPQDSAFLQEINPGNSAAGTIVFDVPRGIAPTIAELHASETSAGVKISLR